MPSRIDGVLRTSSDEKAHWFELGKGVCAPDWFGEGCWLLLACDRGGYVRVECCGGVGTAGGTASRRRGDLERESRSGREDGGGMGGW